MYFYFFGEKYIKRNQREIHSETFQASLDDIHVKNIFKLKLVDEREPNFGCLMSPKHIFSYNQGRVSDDSK